MTGPLSLAECLAQQGCTLLLPTTRGLLYLFIVSSYCLGARTFQPVLMSFLR